MPLFAKQINAVKQFRSWLFAENGFYAKLLCAAIVGVLAIAGLTAFFIFLAVAGGQVLSSLLKAGIDRPRPELVSHLVNETSLSFPSGHAMLSAVTYLTLGALAARFLPGRTTKIYVLSLAVLTTLLVGISRIYLGVHWPSDVLAGWCAGFVWAMLCWLTAQAWQRWRGQPLNGDSEAGD